MRISKKDKAILYNDSLWDRKCHLEYLIDDIETDMIYTDSHEEHNKLKVFLDDSLNEIKTIYKFMHKIYLEIHEKEELHKEEYVYWDRVIKSK